MMKTRWLLLVALWFLSPLAQAFGDTLILRDGTSISGSLIKANAQKIEFADELGVSHTYKASEVKSLRLASGGKDAELTPEDFPKGICGKNSQGECALIQQLLRRVEQLESNIAELRKSQADMATATAPMNRPVAPTQATLQEVSLNGRTSLPPESTSHPPAAEPAVESASETNQDQGGHTMEIPGFGPALKIRGFLDFNFGVGDVANPLVSPLGAPSHATFQAGEFDLFMTSKLSQNLDFLGELVIGADPTNQFGIDIERYELQYKPNEYFQLAAGRFHTAIGYYNTAFHHGTWFQKATGRPFLFLFEDSGGILPVHTVGVSTTGLVPGTGKLNLHWIAEVGNGRRSNPNEQPVQNFLSDKDHKAFNLAFFVKPDWLPGAQFGASYYRDRLVPSFGGLPVHVDQSIMSAHAVFTNNDWEFLNEAVLIRNKPDRQNRVFNTPGFYSQLAKRLAKNYWPYFRYQYVNVPATDLVNPSVGRQDGPSAGIRWDFAKYAGLKVQYNRVYQRGFEAKNGLDTQLAYTF